MPLTRDASLWHSLSGVVAAYQPVRAPGPMLARYNMAYGGQNRYRAMPGTAPTWSSAAGWRFNGSASSQYLVTGIVPATGYSAFVRYNNLATPDVDAFLFGYYESASRRFSVETAGITIVYENGGKLIIAAAVPNSGVLGFSGNTAYRNGVAESGTIGAWVGSATSDFYIGARHRADISSVDLFKVANIQSLVVVSRPLSAADVKSVSRQMAYCDVNPEWNVWARRRQWYLASPVAGFQAAWAAHSNAQIGTGLN